MSRVVVVDDRADDLELYEHILRHGGHDPVTYADPVAALHAIVAEPPDLVVADLLMPELDGFELIHALRSDPATHDQRVVLLSAVYQPHEFAGVGDELSRCTFVAKPATPQELLAGVERALAEDSGGSEPEADFERRHRRALHSKLLTEARRWESAERELTTRARQDAALAELSRRALTGLHGQPLLDAACEAVARQLPADLVEVLKGDGLFGRLLIRAGHGWGSDPTGAVVDVDASAPEAAALDADDPQDVAATVTRGRLSGHGVVAGLQVAIPGVDRPRGILGAYCTVPRVFSSGDREFLRAVATLVGRTQVNADTHTELERREAELRALFDGARDGLVVVDRELRCVRANAAACDILARSERDLIGADAFELAAPESRHALERDWAAVLRDGGGAGRLTLVRRDGTRREVEYTATAEILPGFHLASIRDVTERIAMEEDLRRTMAAVTDAQRRYVELVESLPEGVVAVDGDDAIALVNVRAEELFGYLRGELIGRPLELLLPAPDLTAGDDPVGRRRDGSEFPVEVGVRATGGGDGVAAIRLVTDITGRRELERQLRQTQKLEAVGRLAGGVAHDFNNVLQVVIGRTDELARRARSDDDRSDLADIGAAAERAAALTRQLLAFSRRQALAPVDLDVNRVVGELERMLARLIGDDVLLQVELAPSPVHVRADRSQLEQVILNLVVNARDAMPRGGTIVVSTAPFDDGAGGRWVRLEVSDSGCGMDEATAARAFEPFFTTKGDDRGTGLGLATVHGIATQSGGRVRLRTAPGQGATISIELPAVAAPSATRAWPETERRTAPGGGRVLLVEDDAVVRRLLESMLAELGYDVAAAGDGAAALALGGAFDLVVTDHMLPGMTGPELVERLGPSAPPVLYVSGYAPAAADAPGPAGGRAGFLQKPFGVDELARAARELLDARP